jgi:hypothetical protein
MYVLLTIFLNALQSVYVKKKKCFPQRKDTHFLKEKKFFEKKVAGKLVRFKNPV